jgi:UDP-N-acetylmuramate dehydrogenase
MKIEEKIQKNIALAPLTTFKIGGKAKFFVEVNSKTELQSAITWAKNKNINFHVLGGGSNILVNDGLIDKLIIKIAKGRVVVKSNSVISGAGVNFGAVVQAAIKHKLTGLEWAVGIPGTIGGAVRGNALAFKSSISDVVEMIEVFDIKQNKFVVLNKKQCQFVNKGSVIKKKKNLIIWQVWLKLKVGKVKKIQKFCADCLTIRDNQPKQPSAGCVFINFSSAYVKKNNPDLYTEAKANKIIGNNLISAGWVISRTSLPGKRVGSAEISTKHANFIINTGHAKAEDVIILISLIKQKVRTELNLQLQEEIECLGF